MKRRHLATFSIIALTALTNILVPLIGVMGVAQGKQPLVMSQEVAAACKWLHQHTAWTDTVLAPIESGQFVPAWAGNRVVYGHPFETIRATEKKALVAEFYKVKATAEERRNLLERYDVQYVLAPSLRFGAMLIDQDLVAPPQQEGIPLYPVRKEP
jgi:hypothetical protein